MTATTMGAGVARAGSIYVWMAATCVAVAFGGFALTYWLQLPAGTFRGPGILHLHALAFTAWPLLLLSQAVLGARGQLQHHRAWGVAGVSLATAMVGLGLAVAIRSLNIYLAGGLGDAARSFMWLPLGSLALFSGFFTAALFNLRRPEWHKRLMLVATVAALQAATGRIGFLIATHGGGPGLRPGLAPPPPPETGLLGAILMSLILLAGALYDWRRTGRPHPAYLIGVATLLAAGVFGPMLAHTPLWAGWMDSLSRIAA